MGYGSWFEHVQEFWEHRMDANVLFLKYEDMHRVSSWGRYSVHLARDAVHGAGAVRGAGAVQASGVSTKWKQRRDLHTSFHAQGCRWAYVPGQAHGLCWDRLGSSDVMESLFLDFTVLAIEAGPGHSHLLSQCPHFGDCVRQYARVVESLCFLCQLLGCL